MKPVVDYLIVIPKDEEFGYVREVAEQVTGQSLLAKSNGPLLYARARLPTVKDEEASAVIISVGQMGDAPVQATVEEAIRIWPPAAIALVGIAGSFEPNRVRLGDVLVPTRVFGYVQAKAGVVRGRQRLTYRPTGHQLNCTMSALARAVALPSPSHAGQTSGERITGMRLCSSAQSSLGSVVTIAKLGTRSPPARGQNRRTKARCAIAALAS